jgi:hypothetical protein
MFTDLGRVVFFALCIAGCRGKVYEAAPGVGGDAAVDAETGQDAVVPGNPCRLVNRACVGECTCSPVYANAIDRKRHCVGPRFIMACRTAPSSSGGCSAATAPDCYERMTPDGGSEVFTTPNSYNGWDAGDLKTCATDVREEAFHTNDACP